MITLTNKEWISIQNQLRNDWPRSYVVMRGVMKRELGFTVREHRWYSNQHGTQRQVLLDFYDDAKETWFILKYLNRE